MKSPTEKVRSPCVDSKVMCKKLNNTILIIYNKVPAKF